jgi:hypothetical protein
VTPALVLAIITVLAALFWVLMRLALAVLCLVLTHDVFSDPVVDTDAPFGVDTAGFWTFDGIITFIRNFRKRSALLSEAVAATIILDLSWGRYPTNSTAGQRLKTTTLPP